MAGAGWRDFVAGEVLTAANVQDYLQDQSVMVFGGTAARGSAIASPSEGMTTYLADSNTIETYSGTTWERQTGGLIPVNPTTITAVSGTATTNGIGKVTFSNCTKIQIDGVFSAKFTHYKLVLSVSSSAANSMIQFRFMESGSENSSANYYIQNVVATGTSISTYRQAGISGLNDFSYGVSGNPSTTEANIYNPFTPVKPQVMSRTARDLYNGAEIMETHGGINLTNSFTGISIISNTSNITGKAIVYGWNE